MIKNVAEIRVAVLTILGAVLALNGFVGGALVVLAVSTVAAITSRRELPSPARGGLAHARNPRASGDWFRAN